MTNKLNIDPSLLTHLVQITDKMKVDLQQVNSRMSALEQKVWNCRCFQCFAELLVEFSGDRNLSWESFYSSKNLNESQGSLASRQSILCLLKSFEKNSEAKLTNRCFVPISLSIIIIFAHSLTFSPSTHSYHHLRLIESKFIILMYQPDDAFYLVGMERKRRKQIEN